MSDKMPQLTQRARRVLTFAQDAANQSGSSAIDADHLVLGLLREGVDVTDTTHLKSMEDVEAIFYTVVHDLVSAIQFIKVSAELLQGSGNLSDERAQQFIEYIIRRANGMNEITNGMIASWRAGRSSLPSNE